MQVDPKQQRDGNSIDVVVIGGAVVDVVYKAISPTQSSEMLRTSTPCVLERQSMGGVGRNIAEALTKLEISTRLISVVAKDGHGSQVVDEMKAAGMDVHGVLQLPAVPGVCSTATYTALLGCEGELAAASATMSIFDQMTPDRVITDENKQLIRKAKYVVMETNVPQETIEAVVELVMQVRMEKRRGLAGASLRCVDDFPKIAIDTVSKVKCLRIKNVLPFVDVIKPNEHELGALAESILTPAGVAEALMAEREGKEEKGGETHASHKYIATPKDLRGEGLLVAALLRQTNLYSSSSSTLYKNGSGSERMKKNSHVGRKGRARENFVLCTCGPKGAVIGSTRHHHQGSVSNDDDDDDAAEEGMRVVGGREEHHRHQPIDVFHFPPPDIDPSKILKVTGAGDSFLAGFIFGMLVSGCNLEQSLATGGKAAALALTCRSVISPKLNPSIYNKEQHRSLRRRRSVVQSKI